MRERAISGPFGLCCCHPKDWTEDEGFSVIEAVPVSAHAPVVIGDKEPEQQSERGPTELQQAVNDFRARCAVGIPVRLVQWKTGELLVGVEAFTPVTLTLDKEQRQATFGEWSVPLAATHFRSVKPTEDNVNLPVELLRCGVVVTARAEAASGQGLLEDRQVVLFESMEEAQVAEQSLKVLQRRLQVSALRPP
jgi:hypothetical protein